MLLCLYHIFTIIPFIFIIFIVPCVFWHCALIGEPHPVQPILINLKRCFLDDVNGKYYVVRSFKIDRLSGQIYIPSWFVYGGPPVPLSLSIPPHPYGEGGDRNRWVDIGKKYFPEKPTQFIGLGSNSKNIFQEKTPFQNWKLKHESL